ncbi:hypothetical protein TEA_011839 [Camellia sinensis var. sinensis]|uniref:Fucosyltransferase n=1 Tax=Camellia sinensis var. sinensis TaxID=542762 RepID=A0A4S4E825_CAMSN|nr:hypothetical protein TEA_011839 [Camellia sinensis var. sinensis]
MGITIRPSSIHDDSHNSSGASSSCNTNATKKRWSNLMPFFVVLVVLAEIAFLGRLDIAKNAALLADSFYQFTSPSWSSLPAAAGDEVVLSGVDRRSEADGCEKWLEREDSVEYSRDFEKEPILVNGGDQRATSGLLVPIQASTRKETCYCHCHGHSWDSTRLTVVLDLDETLVCAYETSNRLYRPSTISTEYREHVKDLSCLSQDLCRTDWKSCAVGCKFGFNSDKKADATFGSPQLPETVGVLRSMESAQYYAENSMDLARRRGYSIVMTTSLSSDVPAGYFSWAEYDIMAPLEPKTEKALAAAFISNCGARNFRLQALEALEKADIKIDSYGNCHRNRDGRVEKVQALKRYKFSLAFENSNEEDYVTEKFLQSLVAGSVPVVVGAPNIQDFAPSPDSLLHIRELKDVESIAKTMKYLAGNDEAYNQTLRWKFEGPSDSFKALVDMAAVHSSCRLCIYLATKIREKEEKRPVFLKRPCKCTRSLETVYHLYVRERGRFEMESIFLRSSKLTLEALELAVLSKFESLKHVPIWKPERPESIRGGDKLKIYRIYPVGKTQKEALYTFRFEGDANFSSHIETNPCAKFEVIFV